MTATAWRDTWNVAPPAGSSVRVSSIPALLDALADDAVTEIVVADGTYRVSPASAKRADSLWIGSRFAGRTRPVTVRAETSGGVTFDGGGAGDFGGITFVEGAHHQTWDGFIFQNGTATGTGVIVFGGYAGLADPYNITLKNITIRNISPGGLSGHAVYFSMSAPSGPHDLLLDGLTVLSPDYNLKSAIHFYHDAEGGDPPGNKNVSNVTVRNMKVTGTDQAVMIWARSIRDLVIEDSTITGARKFAVAYAYGSAILRRVVSSASGVQGFYSALGPDPAGITFVDSVLR